MYLTSIQLNPAKASTRFMLGSYQRVHATVMALHPSLKNDERVLWRIDTINNKKNLVILSPTEFDITSCISEYGFDKSMNGTSRTVRFDKVFEKLEGKDFYRFRVAVKPVKRFTDKNNKTVERALKTDKDQIEWFLEKTKGWGFLTDPRSLKIASKEHLDITRKREEKSNGRNFNLSPVFFEGILQITDKEKFVESMKNGMGRGKAYGCGLLTLHKM